MTPSHQSLTINHQPSTINYQLSTINQQMVLFETHSTDPDEVAQLCKDWEPKMRALKRAIVTPEATFVEDLNRDRMVFHGVTFATPTLTALFKALGMMVDPRQLESPPPGQTQREWRITARYPWGHDRIL
jgi:hypothetical protein